MKRFTLGLLLLVIWGAFAGADVIAPTTATAASPGVLTLTAPASPQIAEAGGSTTVQVTRTGGSDGAVGATIGVAGTAAPGDRSVSPATVSFADGDSAPKTVTVSATPDGVVDPNETVILSLTAATGGATLDPGTSTVTIVDGAVPGTLTLSEPASAQIAEAGGVTTLQVSRTGGTVGAVGATIGVAGTAAPGDRSVSPATVSFSNGDTTPKTVTVTATPDTALEPNETVELSLIDASGGAALGPGSRTVTILDGSPPPMPGTGTTPGTLQLPTAAVRATISGLSQSHPVFRVGRTSTPLSGQTTLVRPRGTTFSFRLDQPATVTVRIQRKLPGRRVGRVCRRPTQLLRSRPRCTRLVLKATLRRTARVGLNRIAFSGRARGRALAPGRYRAAFTAANTAGTSPVRALSFTIVAP
jgi:hypothetical protein